MPERLHEEFKRTVKTQTVLPSADTPAILFWALLPCGQINMRKVDGWQTSCYRRTRHTEFQPHPARHSDHFSTGLTDTTN
jgi:hypothetical protein